MKLIKHIFFTVLFTLFWGNSFSQIHNDSLAPTGDSHVFSGSTGTNYGTALTTIIGVNSTPAHYRYLTNFNISGLNIPTNAVIYSAELILTPAGTGEGTVNSTDLYLETVSASWAESTVTYANQPATSTVNQVTTSSLVNGKRTFNITTLVQNIVNGSTVNYGWRIRRNPENVTSSLSTYATKDAVSSLVRPKLKIKWYLPMSITAASINHCNTTTSTDGSITPTIANGSSSFTYLWTNSSGTTVGTSLSLTNRTYGWYGLKVTGSLGDVYYKAFVIGVKCQDVTINFNPNGNFVDDATVSSQTPTVNKGSTTDLFDNKYLRTITWYTQKGLLKFNLWMDASLEVNQANLQLYGKAHVYANSNASYLKKITQNWEENLVTWNSLPSSTATNQVSIPWSTTATQNYLTINTTSFWNDWKSSNTTNYGMLLELQSTANAEAKMSFHSSDTTLTSIRPAISFIVRAQTLVSGTIAAGSTSICSGSTTLLTLSGFSSGATFQWQKSTDNVAFTNISGATSSTYTTLGSTVVDTWYRCVVSLGTCTPVNSTSVQITIKPVPTVSIANTTFCTGTNATLTATPSIGGGTFLWNTGATTAAIVVSPSVTTDYTVVYTLNGCASPVGTGRVTVCGSSFQYNDSTELGSITVSVNEAPSKVGPYHYKISQYPNESISTVYKALKDSLYSGVLDSATFFLGNVSSTNYTFQNLNMGKQYVSVFDSRGVRVFDREILVIPTITLSNNTGISITNNVLTSNTSNAYSMLDLYLSEDKIAEMGYVVVDKSKNHFMGLINSNLTDASDIRNYKYGFSIKSSNLFLIENGIEGSQSYSLQSGSQLALKYQDSLISFYADGALLKTVATTGEFNFKSGVSIALSGVSVQVLPWNFRKKNYYFKVKNVHYYDCEGEIGGFTFNGLNSAQTSFNFNWTVKKDGVQILSGTSNGSAITVLNSSSYGPGIYTLTGIPLVSGPSFTLDVYIGVETTWTDHINYTSVTPNDYSLERTSSNLGTYSYARAENILAPNTNGWIQFNPIFSSINSGSRNILRLLPINSASTSPIFTELGNISITKIAFIRRISWTGPTAGFANLPSNAIVRLKIASNNVEIFVNNQQVGNFQIPTSSSVLLRGHSLKPTEGFDNVITSFNCNPKQPLSTIVYSELKRELDGGFATAVDGVLKFTFDEEYETENTNYLPMKIYDDKHNLLVQSSIDGIITNEDGLPSVEISAAQIKYDFDDNRYELTMSNINTITNNSFYLLEVTTSTGEKRYLKVQYHN